ncbi:MAG TPA: YbhB/YbcL family Raf kinase inhibitor-like protein [Polyangiaceae bacterium]|nr:YbhB/YbcL family Raf kinase inhibitor-like protein [Polyangiaceae bacterium]
MFTLSSPAFANKGEIPKKYTCEGEDASPPLDWKDAPEGTRSFALVVEDPDAPDPRYPKTRWVHWLVFDLPPHVRCLPESPMLLPRGCKQGVNDSNRPSYDGPCPPIGRHRYFFRLYALDCPRLELQQPRRAELERAMQGHVLGVAELVGTYQLSS